LLQHTEIDHYVDMMIERIIVITKSRENEINQLKLALHRLFVCRL